MNLNQLATSAVRAATRLRADHGVGPADSVCPFEIAEEMGLLVRFVAVPSMEGLYSPMPRPTVLIGAERPPARRRYTCGHEIGHHVFGHGTRLDELEDDDSGGWSPDEFIAYRFASALLMPKLAVLSAFVRRGWSVTAPRDRDLFVVAQDLGVGYVTLVGHLERTLRCITPEASRVLRKVSLARLRSDLAGFPVECDLVVADEHWGSRPIDVEIGDVILMSKCTSLEGDCAVLQHHPTLHLRTVAVGVGQIAVTDARRVTVRVSRRKFVGVARYRYLEEPVDDQ